VVENLKQNSFEKHTLVFCMTCCVQSDGMQKIFSREHGEKQVCAEWLWSSNLDFQPKPFCLWQPGGLWFSYFKDKNESK